MPRDVNLAAETTLRVPSVPERVATITTEEALVTLVQERVARRIPEPLTVLGGGSNVILRRRIPGLLCLLRTRGVRVETRSGGAQVTAAAGERWHDLVRYTLGRGLAGLENLALIPGAVGAAPIQNIGAYGVELAECLVSLRALDTATGRIHRFEHRQCRFGYRDSRFRRPEGAGLVILDVTLRLSRKRAPVVGYPDVALELARLGWSRPSPVQVAEAVIRIRRRKLPDPRRTGNVGSFFKNPEVPADRATELLRHHPDLVRHPGSGGTVKLSAAQLIEACGWKGRSLGPVGVWQRQPLVLVNRGGAEGADFLALGDRIRADVARRYGVELELEPRIIGQD